MIGRAVLAIICASILIGAAALLVHAPARGATPATASAPAPAPAPPPVDVSTAILQRDGATLRLLNATVHLPEGNQARQVDVALTFNVSKDGKVSVTSVETTPTSLLGVNTLIPGTYSDGKTSYDIKGPAVDVDMRPTWTIEGKTFYGSVTGGPLAGHPQLGAVKGLENLPESGAYGLVFHDRAFAGIANAPKVLVNLRQVGDTIVITGYTLTGTHYDQTGQVVLQKK